MSEELKWSTSAPTEPGYYLTWDGKTPARVFWDEYTIQKWEKSYAKLYEGQKWIFLETLIRHIK